MTIKDYLAQYNRTEDRVVTWLVQNGADRATAMFILDSYANIDKKFSLGYELDTSLLLDCIASQNKTVTEFLDIHKKMSYKPSLFDKVKSWITQR